MPIPPQPDEASREGDPTRAELERLVHDALDHLYDPVYLQTHPLIRYVRSASVRSDRSSRSPALGQALRQVFLDAIEAVGPGQADSPASRSSVSHQILKLRFVDGLTVSAIQDKLAIGRTTYFAEQRRAVEAIASFVRERWIEDESANLRQSPQLPRLVGSNKPPSNLPLQLTSFVGREREIAEVSRLLGGTRLLTLTGSGGSGKTRLALEVASHLLAEPPEEYPDGVWFVDLGPLFDDALVAQTVALSLGLRQVSGQPILDTLLDYLEPRHLLLLLDNCEHLLDSVTALGDSLLRGCRSLKLLATSREALGLAGETSWRVPSLSLPDPTDLPSPEQLLDYESVRLFVDRASAALPGFVVTEASAPALVQVCWRLDGIPLALELAAARVRVISVEQLATRLDDRFRLLTGGSRMVLPRQRTLRAAVDWSYDLLTEGEHIVFRRLAVFAGGCSLEAAEAVCSGESVDLGEVLDLLSRLVDKSLVLAEVSEGGIRYRFLETIREYARERLEQAGEVETVRTRHRDHYLVLAEQAAPNLESTVQAAWLNQLEREHDNLRSALHWFEEHGEAERGLRLGIALRLFWLARSHLAEGREWLAALLASPDAAGHTTVRAKALNAAASLARYAGDEAAAVELAGETLAMSRELEDGLSLADALSNLAWSARNRADRAKAQALSEESLAIYRQMGNWLGIADALERLGMLASDRADYLGARSLLEESLTAYLRLGDGQGVAWLLQCLGFVALRQGDLAAARGYLKESLTRAWDLRFHRVAIHTLESFAGLAEQQAEPERAVRLVGAASALRQTSAMLRGQAVDARIAGILELAEQSLQENDFARAFAEGQAMTLEQAVEYALQDEAEK